MDCPLEGSIVALPTPFQDGHVDLDAFTELIDYHVHHATEGVVIAGTTGESATLSDGERRALIHAAIEFSAGRLKVVAGVGTNNTNTSVELARFASACGADALMVVTPYYNRPSPRGLCAHFQAIADASRVPIVAYNVPSRTGLDLEPDLMARLFEEVDKVVALKESTSSVQRIRDITRIDGLAVFCGEDERIADFMQFGARGAINVVGNLVPNEVAELVRCARPGDDSNRAAALKEELAPLVRDLFIEVNPVPLKTALASLRRCPSEVRAPLAPLEDASWTTLEATLRARGVLG